jgi:hypothetical protein
MKGKRGNKRSSRLVVGCRIAVLVVSMSMMLAVIPTIMAQEAEVTVTVNAPEYVEEGETFEVTIDVEDIKDFYFGTFDLIFDSSVVSTKETDVKAGCIDETEIPVSMCDFVDPDTIKIMPELSGETPVSGSGYLAKIKFEVEGEEGDACVLVISNGELVRPPVKGDFPHEIQAKWIDAEIRVGVEEEDEDDVRDEVIPVSPNITMRKPAEAVVSNIVGESRTFNISVDQIADIRWQINGTKVQTNESVTEAVYTNASAAIGIWNISVITTNTTTGLSDMHTWIWSVTLTATVTPTPTPATGVTPTPEAETERTPTPTPTLAPGMSPTSTTATPTPEPPGFEALFAIAALLTIAYILLKWSGSDHE